MAEKQTKASEEEKDEAKAQATLDAQHDLSLGMGVRHREYTEGPKDLAKLKQKTYDEILGVRGG